MAAYQTGDNGCIIRVRDGAIIPPDPNNADRQVFAVWLANGGAPDPAPIVPTPANSFTFSQFIGLFTTAEAAAIFSSSDAVVRRFLLVAASVAKWYLADPAIDAGLSYLITVGILTTARKTTIQAS